MAEWPLLASGVQPTSLLLTIGREANVAIYATLVTSMGDIRVRLLKETAPIAVENFVGLATGTKPWTHPRDRTARTDPLYSGTIFHRVIPNFMIQGGDPIGSGTGGPGYRFEDEVEGGPSFDKPGYLAMANSGPGTNGSQFFVTVAPTPWLTRKHTIFGEVVEGQDVAEAISKVPTTRDRPDTDVVLHEVRIERSERGTGSSRPRRSQDRLHHRR